MEPLYKIIDRWMTKWMIGMDRWMDKWIDKQIQFINKELMNGLE